MKKKFYFLLSTEIQLLFLSSIFPSDTISSCQFSFYNVTAKNSSRCEEEPRWVGHSHYGNLIW